MRGPALAVIPSALGMLSGAAQSKPPVPEGVAVLHEAEIGKGGDRALHAELAYPIAPPKAPLPAVVWVHGGGWSGGSHKNNPFHWLATKGYFTASIEYRLSGEAKWSAQLQDCKLPCGGCGPMRRSTRWPPIASRGGAPARAATS